MESIESILNDDFIGKTVTIHGWVYRIRSSGRITFIIIRDSTDIVQCVASSSLGERYNDISSLTIESSLEVTGQVSKDERAVTGYEIKISDFKIYQRNEFFPITKDKSDEFLLDNRHLWLRSREFTSILKIRSTVFKAFADFFYNNGYYQVQGPMMVSTATEGGATLFKLKFFDDDVYLTQSSQFYLETMIFSLEKVFTIAPSFRAEKSRTRRHLSEYWHAEGEAAWLHNDDMMNVEEKMIEYIVSEVLNKNEKDLKLINRDISKLERIKAPFPRIKYRDLINKSREFGMNLKYGDDLGADEEYNIMIHYEKPLFVTNYPEELKTFYHLPDPENPGEILCHDLLAPEGYGEIIGGGERIWRLDELLERMKKAGLPEEDYYWYIDLRRYGSVPHSGFGLGLDRLVNWICNLNNIRDAIPYPRTVRRIKP
ncbi:asparagine--tRNA ligase [Picrophilus oshimae]|uniref:Asparagine--tRNA ligase n=1 Tax=Picrophilus torridus (strain ATCC 700027 / DSM 9790 / JCM 10055 / NBRC 100828 / KAW 2/3) TaxID=1122961 RepID=Q6KZ55_PICTO|nr:asparagine--tRNA ligase [Picrophilus oshimae]AAT43997.1 asparaginyl-tRNA synthetase [Picrophilus oshimae DSM 9789]